MTLILFSAPFSVTYTHTHTHTRVSLGTGRAFVSEKNRRLTCYTVTNTRDLPACLPTHRTHTNTQPTRASSSHTGIAILSSSHTCRGRGGESVRGDQTTWQTHRRYTKTRGETNKQLFLIKKEALSTQRGFGLYRQMSHWLACYLVWSLTQMKVINETRRLWLTGEFTFLP